MNVIKAVFLGGLFFLPFSCQQTAQQEKGPAYKIKINRRGALYHRLNEDKLMLCAHRGFHTNQPENSIPSIQAAIDHGIELVEIDVRTTKDNVMILMHDDTIDRTTTGSGSVHDMTWEELRDLQLLHKDRPTTKRIPTLKTILDTFQHKTFSLTSILRTCSSKHSYNCCSSTIWWKKPWSIILIEQFICNYLNWNLN